MIVHCTVEFSLASSLVSSVLLTEVSLLPAVCSNAAHLLVTAVPQTRCEQSKAASSATIHRCVLLRTVLMVRTAVHTIMSSTQQLCTVATACATF
jgi:hypothetical protein